MSDLLSLKVNPWLLYRHHEKLEGCVLFSDMPNFLTSQNYEAGSAILELQVKKREDGRMLLSGSIEAEALLTCQRCLGDIKEVLYVDIEQVFVKFKHQLSNIGKDEEAIVCEDELNIASLVEQELILSLPMIAKHDDCRANYKDNSEKKVDKHNPFVDIKKLLK